MAEQPVHLIVMTRLPVPGFTKTRLIPCLGGEGAANLHSQLARHTIGRASSFCLENKHQLTISLAGGTVPEAKEWLASWEINGHPQSGGDLGDRLIEAFETAFSEGAAKVIVVGTDCPSLDGDTYKEALKTLDTRDIVIGPAEDGGYYLIGLKKPVNAIFSGINWGSESVFRETIRIAEAEKLTIGKLSPLPDVDLEADLPRAYETLQKGARVSIIIPTLNEEENIPKLLDKLITETPYEIIVADGGSTDFTREISQETGVKVLQTKQGRGAQMNAGAAAATGDYLLFLHVDTFPPADFQETIHQLLQIPHTAGGAFRFELKNTKLGTASLIAALTNLRCRLFKNPYGDQGIFLRKSTFDSSGGFTEMRIAEDLYFIRQLKGLGKIRIAAQPALTSARRWEKHGVVRIFLQHQLIVLACLFRLPKSMITRVITR